MKRSLPPCVATLLVVGLLAAPGLAHAPFGTALKKQYDLRAATCYVCHLEGKDESGKLLGREHLNKFGLALHKLLKDKNINARIEAAKELPFSERKKVNDAATAEFLEALKQLEGKPAADGKTWRELIQSGSLEGVKVKE